MKRILLVIGFGIIAIGQIVAQDVSYWVGQSVNPDPTMRHHEAFMDAFINYINNSSKKNVGPNSSEATCRIETVSSVTYDGRETMTISIGRGALVKFVYVTENISSDDVLHTKTLLRISYTDESNRTGIESAHEYSNEYISEKGTDTSVNQFSYKCIYISRHE